MERWDFASHRRPFFRFRYLRSVHTGFRNSNALSSLMVSGHGSRIGTASDLACMELLFAVLMLCIFGVIVVIRGGSAKNSSSSPQNPSASLRDYQGSEQYKAMLERNGGVAPGRRLEDTDERRGPRGGRYTMATTKDGRRYRRYR